ncbi:MAG TPA: LamG-like jellyroll fold domain-containing protein [Kofleriaceae bacterium]|nr:LamG-like jellyroll fold domain-containing protein [Kofleriaceae bacterium]
MVTMASIAACRFPELPPVEDDTPDANVDGQSVAPDTTITAAPPTLDNSTVVVFEFASDPPGALFECHLDAGAFLACTSPHTLAALTSGAHAFQVRAVGGDGARDPSPAEHSWTIDLTTPDTRIDAGPMGSTGTSSATFLFSSPTAVSGLSFECSLDMAAYSACSSPLVLSNLADGPRTIRVRARDASGAVDPTPATRAWVVDTQAPETTIASGPSGTVANDVADFTFTSNEVGATYQCDVDGAGFNGCGASTVLTNLAQGAHVIAVRAVDLAGNPDASPVQRGWSVDTIAPETMILAAPDSPANSTAQFEFASPDSTAAFECSIDGAGFVGCVSPRMLSGLVNGSHNFRVRAVDPVANVDMTPASHTWSVDTSVPDTVISSGPLGATNATMATFAFSAAGVPGATFECSLDGSSFVTCSSPRAYSTLAEGSHTFQVRARSMTGVLDPSPATRAWSVDVTAPDTTLSGGPVGAVASTSASFTLSSNDASSTFECSLDMVAFAACSSPLVLSGLSQGNHGVRVRARDAAGNFDMSPAQRSWTVDTFSPDTVLDGTPPTLDNDLTATFAFSGEAGARFECSIDGGSYADCTSPHPVPVVDGTHTFAVRAVDAAGNLDPTPATHSWVVDSVAPSTSINSGPPATVASSSATFDLASNENGTFECALDGGAYVTCSDPHMITVVDGAHTLLVRARDAAGNPDPTPASWSWTSDATGPVVTITAPGSGVTTAAYVVVNFTTDEAATTTCRVDGGSFASCASGHSFFAAPGSHTIDVRAVDALGNPSTTSRTWTVQCGQPPELVDAILSLHLEDDPASQFLLNTASPANNATKGDLPDAVDALDPSSIADGRYGRALHFRLVPGDFHSVAKWQRATPTIESQWTLEFWYRPVSGIGTVVRSLPGPLGSLPDSAAFVHNHPSVSGVVSASQNVPSMFHSFSHSIVTSGWHHVVMTYGGGELVGYYDGVRKGALIATFGLNFYRFLLGAQSDVTSEEFDGDIDEIAIGRQALTESQVRARYCPAP